MSITSALPWKQDLSPERKASSPRAARDAVSSERTLDRPLRGVRFTPPIALLSVLLVADLAYAIAHCAVVLFSVGNANMLISYDGGYGEQLQYRKLAVLMATTAIWALWARQPRLLAWSTVFGFLWVDDALSIHENFGWVVNSWLIQLGVHDWLAAVLPVRVKDLGELSAVAVAGSALALLVYIAARRAPEDFRRLTRRLVWVMGLLLFCGVALDMVHQLSFVEEIRLLFHAFTLAEDGGEMVATSIAVAVVFAGMAWSRDDGQRADHLQHS